MRLNQITESPDDTNDLLEQLMDVINTFNPDALDRIRNQCIIFRGADDVPTYGRQLIHGGSKYACFSVTPRMNRKSAYSMFNYYNVIMSDSPVWKEFPKRRQSHIGTTSLAKANDYTFSGNIYAIIPSPAAKIAVCPMADIWDSFPQSEFSSLYYFDQRLGDVLKDNYTSYDDLMADVNALSGDEKMDEEREEIKQWISSLVPTYFKLYNSYASYPHQYQKGEGGREVWFSGPALYVTLDAIMEIIGHLNA